MTFHRSPPDSMPHAARRSPTKPRQKLPRIKIQLNVRMVEICATSRALEGRETGRRLHLELSASPRSPGGSRRRRLAAAPRGAPPRSVAAGCALLRRCLSFNCSFFDFFLFPFYFLISFIFPSFFFSHSLSISHISSVL